MTLALVLLVGCFVATAVLTWLVLGMLRRRQILDHPNERSSHSRPTPRGGGLAVTPVVLLALLVAGLTNPLAPAAWTAALPAAAGLALLSWMDDRSPLPARIRFLAQIAAVAFIMVLLPGWFRLTGLPLVAERCLLGLALVWWINLYNFMDGIDGITGVETAGLGLGLAFSTLWLDMPGEALMPGLALAGAAFGFLLFNWHPAKLFLGDVGSVPLGLVTGWLLIDLAARSGVVPAVILALYYGADATLTLLRRAVRGEKLWQAHREHFYQQGIKRGLSHAWVSGAVALVQIGALLFAWAALTTGALWPLFAQTVLVVLFLAWLAGWPAKGHKSSESKG
ncbi:MAG: MraY family glycosyltransferase [Rhodospirillales bacterium]